MLNGSKYGGAIWTWTFLLLSTNARTQSLPTNLDLPNTTVTSGTVTKSATNSITAASGFDISGSASVTFTAGSRISLEPGFHANAGSTSPTFHAMIGTPAFPITITTAPSIGLSLTVDGTGCTSPCTFQWTAGSAHTIATTATQSGGAGTQYVFANWSDGGIASFTSNPTAGPGPTQFVMRLGTPPGGTALNGQMLMNWGWSGVNSCYIMYEHQSNALTLLNDAATSWTGFQAPGSGGTISNSQCTLDFGASSVTPDGGALVVTLSVTFKPAFVGTRIIWAYDQFTDPMGGWNYEWETIGTYLAYPGTQITFNPPNASLGQTGGPGTTSFSNSGNWTAAISDPWIHLNSPASGSNGGTLSFSADANPTQDLRYGNIAVNGSQFWIYVSELIVSLNPTSATIQASGESGSFDVITSSNWTATTTASWIHLSGTTSGYGLGTVIYTIDPNTGGTRSDVITVAGEATFTITQNGVLVPCTITTAPAGRLVSVDGALAAPSPQIFQWPSGQNHTISVTTTPQAGASDTQYAFLGWSDGGNQSHSITVPSSAATWTANFATQYYLRTVANPTEGGTVNPGHAWHNSGEGVQVTATATLPYYTFSNFSGALSGATNPQTLTMNGPATVTANFTTPNLTITNGSLSNGTVSMAYSQAVMAIGGVPPYSFSITSGPLPPGLALNASTGAISGTPTTAGPYPFTVQVADSASHTIS